MQGEGLPQSGPFSADAHAGVMAVLSFGLLYLQRSLRMLPRVALSFVMPNSACSIF